MSKELKSYLNSWLKLSLGTDTEVTDQDTYWNRHGGSYITPSRTEWTIGNQTLDGRKVVGYGFFGEPIFGMELP